MARCVQISDYFSVELQARFLNFTIYLFYWKSSNLKIWRLSKNAITSIKQITSYELYTLLPAGFLIFLIIYSITTLIFYHLIVPRNPIKPKNPKSNVHKAPITITILHKKPRMVYVNRPELLYFQPILSISLIRSRLL